MPSSPRIAPSPSGLAQPQADARLIAAAPDLAHTVQAAAKVTRRLLDGWTALGVHTSSSARWHRCTGWHPHGCKSEPMSPDEIAYIKEVRGDG